MLRTVFKEVFSTEKIDFSWHSECFQTFRENSSKHIELTFLFWRLKVRLSYYTYDGFYHGGTFRL